MEVESGEDSESADSRTGRAQVGQKQRTPRGKGEGAVQQDGIDAQPGGDLHASDPRFANPVPVFERGIQVSLQEIDGREEVGNVRVAGVQPRAAPEPRGGFRIAFLFEGNAAQFDREALVQRAKPVTPQQHRARLIEAAELRQCHTVVVIEIRALAGERLRAGRQGEEDAPEDHPRCYSGTASRVQLPAAFHSLSNSARCCLTSLRTAGSCFSTRFRCQSRPVTTT